MNANNHHSQNRNAQVQNREDLQHIKNSSKKSREADELLKRAMAQQAKEGEVLQGTGPESNAPISPRRKRFNPAVEEEQKIEVQGDYRPRVQQWNVVPADQRDQVNNPFGLAQFPQVLPQADDGDDSSDSDDSVEPLQLHLIGSVELNNNSKGEKESYQDRYERKRKHREMCLQRQEPPSFKVVPRDQQQQQQQRQENLNNDDDRIIEVDSNRSDSNNSNGSAQQSNIQRSSEDKKLQESTVIKNGTMLVDQKICYDVASLDIKSNPLASMKKPKRWVFVDSPSK